LIENFYQFELLCATTIIVLSFILIEKKMKKALLPEKQKV